MTTTISLSRQWHMMETMEPCNSVLSSTLDQASASYIVKFQVHWSRIRIR